MALLLAAPAAYAQDEGDESQPASAPAPAKPKVVDEPIVVNQRKPFLHTSRVEVMPMAGATVNDPFLIHYSAGAAINYYFSDVLSVGVQGQKYFETSSGLDFDVIQLGAVPDLNQLQFYGGVHFNYIPIYGKFALFNSAVVGFDTYVDLGAGLTGNDILEPFAFAKVLKQADLDTFCNTTPGQGFASGNGFCVKDANGQLVNKGQFKDLQLALSPSAGAGFRFFLTDFVSLTFDLKDYFFQETTLSNQKVFTQNVVFSIGTSFFFPSAFQYTTPR